MDNNVKRLVEFIDESERIVFFGGAGVSTESGIPDFRSKDGLYNQHNVQFDMYSPEYLLSHDCLFNNPDVFYEFYRQKMDTRNIEPNITHKVLAKLEHAGKLSAVVTQNIDGLHQKAGGKSVYEIHGTTLNNYCVSCGEKYNVDFIFDSNEEIPYCPKCGNMVRPDVVMYGEQLPNNVVEKALDAIEKADMLIIGGTSLSVYPAAGFIHSFHGRHIAVINRERLDVALDLKKDVAICDTLGNVFREIEKLL